MEKILDYEYADIIEKRLNIDVFELVYKVSYDKKCSIYDINNVRFDFFLKLLRKYFSNIDFHNLLRCIDNAVLKNGRREYSKEEKNKLKRGSCAGYYEPGTNILVIKKKNDYNAVIHEMFHLSSNYSSKIIGFDQITEKRIDYSFMGQECSSFVSIGRALNEGATENFTEEVTGKGLKYFNERRIAKLVKLVVGDDFFNQAYFNADLYSLLNEMLKYSNRDDVNKIINYSDVLLNYLPDNISNVYHYTELKYTQNLCFEITNLLFKMLMNKIRYLSNDEAILYLNEFISICELKPEKLKRGEKPFTMMNQNLADIIKVEINRINIVK